MLYSQIKSNKTLIFNQLKVKGLSKSRFDFVSIKSVISTINLFKLKSFNESILLESLFLLEFLSSGKATINFFKKMYTAVNIQVAIRLRNEVIFNFLMLLKIFYFPILRRRNILLTNSINSAGNYILPIPNVNLLPFLPDVYFRYAVLINSSLILNTNNPNLSNLYLSY